MKFKLTPIQKFLCLAIRHKDYLDQEELKSLFTSYPEEEIFKQAEINGVSSIVAHTLITIYGKENVSDIWINAYDSVDKRIASYMEELERAAVMLSENNIKLLALKNSGITKVLYPYYGSCPMGDIDVLVAKEDFRQAHEVLKSAGYQLKFRSPLEEDNIEEAEKGGGAEYLVKLPNGDDLWFELQWRPVAGRWIQPEQEPKAEDLVKNAVKLPTSEVHLLSNEDNLLQVSLHTAKHTFVRAPGFRLHTDVDRIVSSVDINWELFITKVTQLRTKTAVYFSLSMAKSLVGTEVPSHVLDELRPSKIKEKIMVKWLEKVGIFHPDDKKWSNLGYIIFVSLLYDSFGDFWKGIFPSVANIRQHYDVKNNALLPYYYLKRIISLIWKRVR